MQQNDLRGDQPAKAVEPAETRIASAFDPPQVQIGYPIVPRQRFESLVTTEPRPMSREGIKVRFHSPIIGRMWGRSNGWFCGTIPSRCIDNRDWRADAPARLRGHPAQHD